MEPLFFKSITAHLIKALHTKFHDLWSGYKSRFLSQKEPTLDLVRVGGEGGILFVEFVLFEIKCSICSKPV